MGLQYLIADDDTISRAALEHVLVGDGEAHAVGVSNGQQALARLESRRFAFDLVITDLDMPRMSGLDLIRALGAAHYRGGLAIIASEDEQRNHAARQAAREAGLDILGWLSRPVTREQVAGLQEQMRQRCQGQVAGGDPPPISAQQMQAALQAGEFYVVHQPVVGLDGGRLLSIESLVRWRSPQRGMIATGQLLAEARRHGLLDAVRRLVVGDLLRVLADLGAHELYIPGSLNVALDELGSMDLKHWTERFAAAGVRLSDLILEIEEADLARCSKEELLWMSGLRRLGIGMSVAGTDPASLDLEGVSLPLVAYKLGHRALVESRQEAARQEHWRRMVRMVQSRGLLVVAQGVETGDDLQTATELACDAVQGYQIAPPMRAFELSGWCRGWNASRSILLR